MEADIQKGGNNQNEAAKTSGIANAQAAAGGQSRPGTGGPRTRQVPSGAGTENELKREGNRSRPRHERGRRDRTRSDATNREEAQSPVASANRTEGGKGGVEPARAPGRTASEQTAESRRDRQRGPRNTTVREGQPFKERRLPDPARIIKKREETLEDIRADIERVEKDIQFEIKQIQTVILGL